MGILVTYVVKLPRRGLRDSLRRGELADRPLLRITCEMAISQPLPASTICRDNFRPADKPGINSLERAYAFPVPNPVRSSKTGLVDHLDFGTSTGAFFSTASLSECTMSRLMGPTSGTGM